jgi:hypothetical protein
MRRVASSRLDSKIRRFFHVFVLVASPLAELKFNPNNASFSYNLNVVTTFLFVDNFLFAITRG